MELWPGRPAHDSTSETPVPLTYFATCTVSEALVMAIQQKVEVELFLRETKSFASYTTLPLSSRIDFIDISRPSPVG